MDVFSAPMIQFVAPAGSELFSLLLILHERPMNAFANERIWEGRAYSKFHETTVGEGLYRHGNEIEESLDEVVQRHTTSSSAKWMLTSL